MADKLTPRQKAQLEVLETLPKRFEHIHRLVEEIAGLRADESLIRRLCRTLDEGKAAANAVNLSALSETMGMMGMLARRGGGVQMKVRGLRDGLASLRVNFEGALRSAKTPETGESDEGGGPGESPTVS
jgi:hypothetical protein